MLLVATLAQPAFAGECRHGGSEEASPGHAQASQPHGGGHAPDGDSDDHECCDGMMPAPTQADADSSSGCCAPGALCGATGTAFAAIPVAFETRGAGHTCARPESSATDLPPPVVTLPFRPPIS